MDADSYIRLKKWFGGRTISDSLTQKKHDFKSHFGQRLLEIGLPWQQLRSQVIKNYLKLCVIR